MRDLQPTPRLSTWSGQKVGDLILGGQIGEGPHGEVYVAATESGESEHVVKVLERPLMREEARLRRFRDDIETLELLDHPDILLPERFQTLDDSHIAIVKPRSNGVRLRSLRGRLRPSAFIDVLKRTAAVLDAAHAVGCFHGHLHESNIFVALDDSTIEHVEVTGFATLHLIDERSFSPSALRADDIFGLGLVAFREITGAEYRSEADLGQLIRHSTRYPVRFCQAVERWLDPNPDRRPQRMRQIIGLLEFALVSTDPAQSFPVGVSKGPAPSAAIVRPPKTTISEISEATDDAAAAPAKVARSWQTCAGKMLWLDDKGVLWQRDDDGNDTLIDTGGDAPTAFNICHDAIAFAAAGGEVHVLEASGIRRVSKLGREVCAVAPAAEQRQFLAATVDGRLWYKGVDSPRPVPVGFLNPDEGIMLRQVGDRALVLHGSTAWIAPLDQPADVLIAFEGAVRIDGGLEPETFVVWTGRRWSVYNVTGELLETGRTGAGPRPGRISGRTWSTFRDLNVE